MHVLIWVVYFATDIYGHVALKNASGEQGLWNTLFSVWGVSAGLSWVISALTWTLLLSRNSLLTANTISALTYVLITLAAWVLFREAITLSNLIGVVLVCTGIYLVLQ